jgi:hypothetical protein
MKEQSTINREITRLKDVRTRVRPKNMFGQSNVDLIDAQIRVLEDRMSLPKIGEVWGWFEDAAEEEREDLVRQHEAASEACNWITSSSAESPSKVWEPICTKKAKK